MADEPVRVTVADPVTGDTETAEIGPHGYVLTLGSAMEVTSMARYANGTVQFTIKPVAD